MLNSSLFPVYQRRPPESGGDPGSNCCGSAAPRPPACVLGGPVPGRIPRRPRPLGRLQRCHTPGRYSNHRLYTANEGPVRIQYKCLVPIYVSPEMKLCMQPRYFQNRIIMFCLPIPTLIHLREIFIFPGSVRIVCCSQIQYVDRSWEYINRS
jgi:hypothetical protein